MNFVEPICLFVPGEAGRVRSRIGHTFLDHELSYVSVEDALFRWKLGEWTETGNRLDGAFQSYLRDAIVLADRLLEFSPAMLIDTLTPFEQVDTETRSKLKHRLGAWYLEHFNLEKIRTSYVHALNPLRAALEQFRLIVNDAGSSSADVERGWVEVQATARGLKEFIDTGPMPKSIVLPLDIA